MGKFLFWAIVIVSALLFARLLVRQQSKGKGAGQLPPATGSKAKPTPEAMVRCEHCGIHLPRSEAVLVDGRIGCSAEHARLGKKP